MIKAPKYEYQGTRIRQVTGCIVRKADGERYGRLDLMRKVALALGKKKYLLIIYDFRYDGTVLEDFGFSDPGQQRAQITFPGRMGMLECLRLNILAKGKKTESGRFNSRNLKIFHQIELSAARIYSEIKGIIWHWIAKSLERRNFYFTDMLQNWDSVVTENWA
ncbi:hypothetical protein FRX31_021945 [Thalictrum thalictroides]|uniref:Uncharacterized protein n=1 Tax=Thalictrum thalictroides TaxID=46969 RepID=A0A7J6VV67_THATH|nr:hypothetical protein FRX31_021945 [Thalictrum thalictroides]